MATTERWLISVPVWGVEHVEEFCATALPALDRAVAALCRHRNVDARLIIHTDSSERISAASSSVIEFRPVPAFARTSFDCMSQAHREALRLGLCGDVVVLLTGGSVISEFGLAHCASLLDNPSRRLILCASPRVLLDGPLPDTADGPSLMAWAWAHRHPMVDDCIWPDGCSADLSRVYFVSRSGSVVTRNFLPHPLALRVDGRRLQFTPTIDANLMQCFDEHEMYVVTNCRYLALLKLTAACKAGARETSTMAARAVAGEVCVLDPLQNWSAGHRIWLLEAGGDEEFTADLEFMRSVITQQ